MQNDKKELSMTDRQTDGPTDRQMDRAGHSLIKLRARD